LRSIADHDLGSRQVERKKGLDILFDGHPAIVMKMGRGKSSAAG